MNFTSDQSPLVANLVSDENRLSFLPAYFGPRLMMRGESLVYGWLSQLSEDYGGGFWSFYTLSNGGFYMAPDYDTKMRVVVPGNGFSREMSADAAGIVANLFALCQLASEAAGTDAGDMLIDRYHALREFVDTHPEGGAIFAAID